MHDAEFRQAEKDWHSFVAKLTERLIEIDDTIPELPVKDVVGHACLMHENARRLGSSHSCICRYSEFTETFDSLRVSKPMGKTLQ